MRYDPDAELRRVEEMADMSSLAFILGSIALLLIGAAGVLLFMAERNGG